MAKGLKKTQADVWFSKCVRIRVNWVCEYCNVDFSNDRGLLHCSHFVGRGKNVIRCHPQNALAHCHICHERLGGGRWGGGNIAEFASHYDSILGEENRELIRLLSFKLWKGYKKAIPLMAKHYKSEYERIEQLRYIGCTERVEFKAFDGCEELTEIEKEVMACLDG